MSKIVEMRVQPIRVDCECDCGTNVENTGMTVEATDPAQPTLVHRCPACKKEFALATSHPYIRFVKHDEANP